MFKIKDWCAVAVSRSFSAVQDLVHGGRRPVENVDQPVIKTEVLNQDRDKMSNIHARSDSTIHQHTCILCNLPSFRCVALNGTNVDLKQTDHVESFSTETLEKVDVSTQTSCNSNLPDILNQANSSNLIVQLTPPPLPSLPPPSTILPPPPPPPPPPPLPLIKSVPTEHLAHRKKVVKKRKSGIVTEVPEITEEAIRKVKLKRPEERILRSKSNIDDNSPRAFGQPVLTKEALQKVSLRKTSLSHNSNRSARTSLSDTNENSECGNGEVFNVKQFLKRTRLNRSPGGTPLPSKKMRQPGGTGTPKQKIFN